MFLGINEGMGPTEPGATAFQSAKAWHGVTVWVFDGGRRCCATIATREARDAFFASLARGVGALDSLVDSDASGGWAHRPGFRHVPEAELDPRRGWR